MKKLKKQANDTYESLRKIVSKAPGHFYWKDSAGTYLGCNDNQAMSLGYPSGDEIIGKTDFDLPWKAQAAKLREIDLLVMESGKDYIAEETVYLPENQQAIFLSRKVPLWDAEGKNIIGIIGTSLDITIRKRMEAELRIAKERAEAANHAKTEFLENMRHDIRTPLSGIIGFAHLLKTEIMDPKLKEYIDTLVSSSEALLELLNNILETIRLSTGEFPILKQKFSLREKLDIVFKLNQAKAVKQGLSLTFEYADNVPQSLIGDPIRLQRIVLELVTNALKYTPVGFVRVIVELAKQQERQSIISLKVQDTGVGIPPDKIQEIFTRFTRLTPAHEGTYKGLGLGLANVKQFIEDLQAEIEVDSGPQGSTFLCLFPFQSLLIPDALENND